MLQTPPLLLAAALLFWGWQGGLIWFAALMAVIVEASRWVRWRLDFTLPDYNRLFDLCTVLVGMTAVYCITTRGAANEVMMFFESVNFTGKQQAMERTIGTAYVFFQWWPIVLFPIVVVQAYGAREILPWSTFSLLIRRQLKREGKPQLPTPGCNVAYPYFAICLLSSSLTNYQPGGFYFGFCLLVAIALWSNRPRRFSKPVWVIAFLGIAALGYWGQLKLHQLQAVVETKFAGLISEWFRGTTRREIGTDIGFLGRMKGSGTIVMRLKTEGQPPELLKDVAYNTFMRGRWALSQSATDQVHPELDGQSWRLLGQYGSQKKIEIAVSLPGGSGLLAAPVGTVEFLRLPVASLATNRLSVKKVAGAPSLLVYDAIYGKRDPFDSLPLVFDEGSPDLNVPREEQKVTRAIVNGLRLEELPKSDRVQAIADYFVTNRFQYSTFLPAVLRANTKSLTMTGFFLTRSKAGHCELFATATVLLLREAGIPARYVVGWSVQEEDGASDRFIVRERHAHAWTEYWLNGHWRTLETTPSSWFALEEERASFWEPIRDRWSDFWHGFARWRYYGATEDLRKYLLSALLILVAVLAGRLVFRKRRGRTPDGKADANGAGGFWPGADSEFYAVERKLIQMGYERYAGETLTGWATRLQSTPAVPAELIRATIRLHYRYRFDPLGVDASDRKALRSTADQILRLSA